MDLSTQYYKWFHKQTITIKILIISFIHIPLVMGLPFFIIYKGGLWALIMMFWAFFIFNPYNDTFGGE